MSKRGDAGIVHVLMVAERLPPAIGGVERHVAGLARELTALGIRVTLVAPRHDARLPEEEFVVGARVLRMPTRPGRTRYPAAWRWWGRHRSLLLDADILHFHGVYSLLHLTGPCLALAPRRPRFITFHGYEMRMPVRRRARLYHAFSQRLTRASLCVGHFLVRWLGVTPTAVTYGACSVPTEVVPLPIEPSAVFVGRLAPDTGLEIVIRGLGLLRRRGVNLPLQVCGNGPSRRFLERIAREEGVSASFHGFVDDPSPFVASATLVFASGYLAMLEAMAYRRPLCTVFHNKIKEDYLRMVPGAAGLFFMAGDPATLADQVEWVLTHGPHQEMLDASYEFAAAHSWPALAQQYVSIWGG